MKFVKNFKSYQFHIFSLKIGKRVYTAQNTALELKCFFVWRLDTINKNCQFTKKKI